MRGWRSLLASLVAVAAMASEGWHRPFSVLGPDQGLPTGAITSLTQDTDGFIWVGTESGLLRYEGALCSRWTRDEGLPADYVHRALADPAGGVWVATTRGTARIRDGRIELAVLGRDPAAQAPTSMAFDVSGRLWIITSRGIYVQQDGVTFSRQSWTVPGRMHVLSPGLRGEMHLGTDQGLYTFLPDGRIRAWGPAQGLPREGVSIVAEDGAGRIWAGTGRSLRMKAREAERFSDESGRLKGSLSPNSLPFVDTDGSLWLPTQAGALHVNGAATESVDATLGLPFRWVRTVFRDREGTLWVLGTTLARLQGGGRVWNHSLASSTSGEVVWSITRDASGRMLAATDDGAIRVSPAGLQRITGTEGRRIKNLAVDQTGLLWMVSTIGPTLWLRPGSTRAEIAPLGDLGHAVNTVMMDSRGKLWLGHTHDGLLRWDPAGRRLVPELGPAQAAGNALGVFRVREDRQGRLWAATTAGLFVREDSGVWRLFNEVQGLPASGLYGMAFLPDGTAWLHFQEGQGLMRVRVEGDRLSILERRVKGQGLRSNLVYAVEVDDRGRTWATTDVGLDRLDPPLHVGRREGMVSEDCAILALLTEQDRVWVGTAAGLVRYEGGPSEPQGELPRAHLLQVTQGERRLQPPFDHLKPIPAGESSVAIRVAVPSYRNEGQTRIQVRLLGLEDAWRDLDAPQARYPALPGGRYQFEARVVSPEGAVGPVTSLAFQVRPPWWRSWWMVSLEGLVAVAAVMLILWARLHVLARSKAELEALVARRTDELTARNEELSLALGNVKQLSGLLPICACCKKIRDDKGYWNQLEQYISEHSDVGFSHGICPDCVETVFPGRTARQAAKSPADQA
ncbi:MAG: Diguanylate cyclase [Holophagaceae bacterium]|nr:Diguanylate cyclase [Holophagaceae bacterium]